MFLYIMQQPGTSLVLYFDDSSKYRRAQTLTVKTADHHQVSISRQDGSNLAEICAIKPGAGFLKDGWELAPWEQIIPSPETRQRVLEEFRRRSSEKGLVFVSRTRTVFQTIDGAHRVDRRDGESHDDFLNRARQSLTAMIEA